MIRELGVPVTALAATASDVYRKPKTGTGVKRVCNNSNNSKRGGGGKEGCPRSAHSCVKLSRLPRCDGSAGMWRLACELIAGSEVGVDQSASFFCGDGTGGVEGVVKLLSVACP